MTTIKLPLISLAIAACLASSLASAEPTHAASAPSLRQIARGHGGHGKGKHARPVLSAVAGWTCTVRELEQGHGSVRECIPTVAIEADELATYR